MVLERLIEVDQTGESAEIVGRRLGGNMQAVGGCGGFAVSLTGTENLGPATDRAMQVFLYEFTTGGGLLSGELGSMDADSLLAEGAAMVQALAEDFAAIEGVEVVSLRDVRRVPDLQIAGWVYDVADTQTERLMRDWLARESAWTLIIAPELQGVLAARCELARREGGRLLNCLPEATALAADKHALAQHLAMHGVPVPEGVRVGADQPWPTDFELPAVIKPCDGAGSCGVQLIRHPTELAALPPPKSDYRLEGFCPGMAASVGLLCGPRGNFALPACLQHLGGTSGFEYRGGSLPLEPDLNLRARSLALRAANCISGLLGFVGVDLILGAASDGSQDYVIEVNPRVTTSYVGLRAAAEQNLAEALLAVAEGREMPPSFEALPVRFFSDGRIRRSEQAEVRSR